jgi:hypothetical protein
VDLERRPTRINGGPIEWRRPRYSTLHEFIANPAYGGAYAYGKTGVSVQYDGAGAKARVRRKPRAKTPYQVFSQCWFLLHLRKVANLPREPNVKRTNLTQGAPDYVTSRSRNIVNRFG